jgi:hypothetical protein
MAVVEAGAAGPAGCGVEAGEEREGQDLEAEVVAGVAEAMPASPEVAGEDEEEEKAWKI